MTDKCNSCGSVLPVKRVCTGRVTPPYSYEVGGCVWFNGEFVCDDCVRIKMIEAAKNDISPSFVFKAIGSREKVF